MNTPWLSLLIPFHGVAAWLPACLDSVVAQVDAGVEVLLLDDASPDACAEIAAAYVARQPQRMRLLSNARNRGIAGSRNRLLEEARGEYLWFVDSDDLLLPGACVALRALVQAQAPDLVLCDYTRFHDRPRWFDRLRARRVHSSFSGPSRRLLTEREEILGGVLEGRELHVWSKIATRAMWDGLRFPDGRVYEDIPVAAALAARARRAWHMPEAWIGYRQRGSSVVHQATVGRIADLLHAVRDLDTLMRGLPGGASARERAAQQGFMRHTLASAARKAVRLDADASMHALVQATVREVFPQGIPRGSGWRGMRQRHALQQAGWWPR